MAARSNTAAIKSLLEEYGQLETRRINVELKRDRELAPLKAAYEKKAGPIVEAAYSKIESIRKRQAVLEGEIQAQMLAGADEKAETVAVSEVVVELETTKSIAAAVVQRNAAEGETLRQSDNGAPLVRAIATVDVKPGNREIDPRKFLEAVQPSKRTDAFWSCLKVLMGEADKFLGKVTAGALAKSKKNYSVSVSLKP